MLKKTAIPNARNQIQRLRTELPKTLPMVSMLILNSFTALSEIHVADQNIHAPGGSHIEQTVQDAVDNAAPGDTVHIVPASDSYSGVVIDKELVLFGIGFRPQKEMPLPSVLEYIELEGPDASGTVIKGLKIEDGIRIATAANSSYEQKNLLISMNHILDQGIVQDDTSNHVSNVIIKNNLIGTKGTTSQPLVNIPVSHHVNFRNNILYGAAHSGFLSVGEQCILAGNLFRSDAQSASYVINRASYSQFRDNILYGTAPLNDPQNVNHTTFYHNLTYNTSNDTLPPASMEGRNNIESTDPLFENLPLGTEWDDEFDPGLSSNSPAADAGTGDQDLGPLGGVNPFDSYYYGGSPLPLIKVMDVPAEIYNDEDLEFFIRAVTYY